MEGVVWVPETLMDTDDIWGLSESGLLLIEDEIEDLLKEDEDHECCNDDRKSSFGCKSD